MRTALIVAAAILVSIGAQPAVAQILITPNPYSQLFVQSVRQNSTAWRQLGVEASEAISPKLKAVEVTLSCGRYTELEASYSNGMIQDKEIPDDEATQARLGNLFAVNTAMVSFVEVPCMN